MTKCVECREGSLVDGTTDTWMRDRNGRWVLLVNVAAQVCDVCGDTSFSAGIAKALAAMIDPDRHEILTAFVTRPVFDVAEIERQRAEGGRPILVTGTGEQAPHIVRLDPPMVVTIAGTSDSHLA